MSDGVVTTGEDRIEKLQEKVVQLKPSVVRLDILAFGGIRDEQTLHALITAGLHSDGVVVDGDLSPAAAERFGLAALSFVPVVAGAEWVWPTVVRGVQEGDAVLLYASVPPATALNISACAMDSASDLDCPALSGIEVTPAATALLERFWAGARIDRLLQLGNATMDEAVELSVQHRVLNKHTALLVLESESDYDLFKIDRNALTSILVIDGDGLVAELNRTFQPLPAAESLPPAPSDADDGGAGSPDGDGYNMEMRSASGAGGPEADLLNMSYASPVSRPAALLILLSVVFLCSNTRASSPSFELLLVLCLLVFVVPSFAQDQKQTEAYEGKFKDVMDALAGNDVERAAKLAEDWIGSSSGRTEVLALVALGEVEERRGSLANLRKAARVYGSCIIFALVRLSSLHIIG